MNSTTINQINIIKQDAMDIGYMTKKGFSLTVLLHNIIREYGTYKDNNFIIDVDNLDIADKRLLLSHFESAEWYEYACESHIKTEALFSEIKEHVQKILDEECFECYQSVMEEMRDYR